MTFTRIEYGTQSLLNIYGLDLLFTIGDGGFQEIIFFLHLALTVIFPLRTLNGTDVFVAGDKL